MKSTGRWVLAAGLLFTFAFPPPASSQVATRAPDITTTTNAPDQAAARTAPQWQARNRGAHQTEWFSVRYQTNAGTGRVRATTNSYVELGTGLNRLDATTGKWVESREEIELVQGGAIARQGQHTVAWAANINTAGAIVTTASDGKVLRSHVLGLAYTDASTGASVLIAGVRDTIGEVARNQVIYRDAFDGPFKADLRYTYTKGGFEQDVIFRESPPAPEKFGMDRAVARLEVWTEFLSPPEPVKTDAVLKVEDNALVRAAMVDPDLTDETLDFGAMRISAGTAFSIDEGVDAVDKQEIPVGKNWLRLEGRNFLIEKVDFEDASPSLEKLPAAPELQPGDGRKQAALPARPKQQLLASLRAPVRGKDRAEGTSRPMRLAAAFPKERGFVLDYTQVNSQADMVFRSDTTYYVSSTVNLTGTTVIEGGTVVKYTPGASTARLSIAGSIDCRTEGYRPAFFTARDDNSVGEIIAGSTGTPTGYYASHIFWITDSTSSYDFHDLRLRHGNQAILRTLAGSAAPMTFRHSQVQDCNRAFGNYASPLTLRNVLVYRTRIGFYSSAVNIGENVTFHRIHQLVTGSMPPLQLKNTLLISCTNNVSYVADPTVFKPATVADAGIFQTVGLGSHYLAAGSPHRGQGTPNINPTLLSDLKHTTTWPPIVLSGALAEDKILGPDVLRNSTTAPDLGYAYSGVDYLSQNLVVQGTAQSPVTLLVTNGAVVGTDPTAGNYGIQFGAYSELVSVGEPGKLNRFARIRAVQETEVPAAGSGFSSTFSSTSSGTTPNARLRFTDLPIPSGWYYHFVGSGFRKVTLQDCRLWNGYWEMGYEDPSEFIALTNSLLHGVVLGLYTPVTAHFRNNLFKNGRVSLDVPPQASSNPTFWDNLFDGTAIEAFQTSTVNHDYNAYVDPSGNPTRLDPPASNDKILTASPAYETGPFGDFYLPSTATQLIDQGSRNAASAGLYHYTTSTTDATKEGGTQVDIGVHFVGATSGNEPVDTDGDGFADYYEDRSGNGRHEMSLQERRWQGVPQDPVLVFSPLPLEYFPGAGLVNLDTGVTVADNFAGDENFTSFGKITVETAIGDFVRFLPDFELTISSGILNYTPAGYSLSATISGEDGTAPFVLTFQTPALVTPDRIEELLRKLKYVANHVDSSRNEYRSVRVTLEDGLGLRTSAARQIKTLSHGPTLIVDVGSDIVVPYSSITQPVTVSGRISSLLKCEHVFVEWTLVEPVLWKLDEIPDPPSPPYPPWENQCPAGSPPNYTFGDLFDQENGNNPKNAFSLEGGQEVTFPFSLTLPLPSINKYCYGLPDYYLQAWRYRFRLTATDGNRTVSDEVIVRILPDASDEVPEVHMRPLKPVKPDEYLELSADVMNEIGESISYFWSVVAPEGSVSGEPGSSWSFANGVHTLPANDPTATAPKIKINQTGQFNVRLCITDQHSRTGCDKGSIYVCSQPASPADIVVAVDYSGSLAWQPLYDAESAVLSLLQAAEPGLHRIGLVAFSQEPKLLEPLSGDPENLIPALRDLVANPDFDAATSVHTLTRPALQMAVTELFSRGRPNTEKVIVLVSDGIVPSFDMESSVALAQRLRKQGVRIITIVPQGGFDTPEIIGWSINSYVDLLNTLQSPPNSISAYIGGLPEMGDVMALTGMGQPFQWETLLAGLNRLIRGENLYSENVSNPFFSQVTKSARTLELLNSDPVGYDLMRLNRALLADAFPGQIRPMTSEQSGYGQFMASLATSKDEAYVASSSGIANILTRMASSVCAQNYVPLAVDLGPDKTILVGQEVSITAALETEIGVEAGEIVTHYWSQSRAVPQIPLIPSPTSQPVSAPLAPMDVSGPNDSEILIHDFPEAGDYIVSVEVRSAEGGVARDQVKIKVLPIPVGDSYEDVIYGGVVAVYTSPVSGEYSCREIEGYWSSGGTPPNYVGGPVLFFPCHGLDRIGNHRFELPAPPGPPGGLPRAYLCDPKECSNPRDRRLEMYAFTYAFDANGKVRILHSRLAWPQADCFKPPFERAKLLELPFYEFINQLELGYQPYPLVEPSYPFVELREVPADICSPMDECDKWGIITPSGADHLLQAGLVSPDLEAIRDPINHGLVFRRVGYNGGTPYETQSWYSEQITGFISTYKLGISGNYWRPAAGADQTAFIPANSQTVDVQLQGQVVHRWKPGIAYTPTWSLVNAPSGSSATFQGSVNSLSSTVRLDTPGSYVFKLTVEGTSPCSQGLTSVSDLLTIHVDQTMVNAGPDSIVDWTGSPVNTVLQGSASANYGTVTWYTEKEPSQDAAHYYGQTGSTLAPTVTFDLPGVYEFRLDTGHGSDTVVVEVNAPPQFGSLEHGPTPFYYSPTLDNGELVTTDGLQLFAIGWDDELPTDSTLSYRWRCVDKPPGAECFINNSRSQGADLTFSAPGIYKIELTLSDGRLETSQEILLNVSAPVVLEQAFFVTAGTRANALELFAGDSTWKQRYSKVEFGSPGPDPARISLELAGKVLRYTPPELVSCDPLTEFIPVILTGRYGSTVSSQIRVMVSPAPPSSVDYERNHTFKFMIRAGEGAGVNDPTSPPQTWNLRQLLALCQTSDAQKLIYGPSVLLDGLATALGNFRRLNDATGPQDNLDLLEFTPVRHYSGEPLPASLTLRMAGLPGRAKLEFLLLPDDSNPNDNLLGELDQAGTIEVEQELLLTSFRPSLNAPTLFYDWIVHRLDGPDPTPPIVPTHPFYPDSSVPDWSQAKFIFEATGSYKITLEINNVEAGSTTVLVVPKGSLYPGEDQTSKPGFDEFADDGTNPDDAPGRASILNLPLPTYKPIENKTGLLELKAQAAGPTVDNHCSFRVLLFPADAGDEVEDLSDDSRAKNITTLFGLTVDAQGWCHECRGEVDETNVEFGSADLTGFTNGNYYVQVWARGVLSDNVTPGIIGKSFKHPILLNTARKPGKVQFSETNFNLAAADGRLRVSRNYDSEMAKPADFNPGDPEPELGWGWTLSSFDLGVQLYEYRADVVQDERTFWIEDDGTGEYAPTLFNVRAKGAHHVTLNLPWSGRRVTFLQSIGEDDLPYWQTPDGEAGQLDADLGEKQAFASLSTGVKVQWFGSLSQYSRSQDQFDFSQFTLTGPDGTKYYLTRGTPEIVKWAAWGDRDPMQGRIYPNPPALTKVEFPDGASMERSFNGGNEVLNYYPTRAIAGTLPLPITITIVRDSIGKIKEIKSSQPPSDAPPSFDSANTPLVKYDYYVGGASDKNLWKVSRLSSANPLSYEVTEYVYDNGVPHLIAQVINPLRLISFQATWQNGKLITTTDAAGIQRKVDYYAGGTDPDGTVFKDRVVTSTPYGNKTSAEYNAIADQVKPRVLNESKSDDFGNVVKTSVSASGTLDPAWPVPSVATSSQFDETKIKSSTDAAGRITSFFYNADGRLEETRRPGGIVERVGYDELGVPSAVSDARRNASYSTQVDGRPVESVDAKGNITKIAYLESGELKGRVDYVEDALGNRTYTTYYKTGDPDLGDNPLGSVRGTHLLEKQADGSYDENLKLNTSTSTYYKNGLLKTSESNRTGHDANGVNVPYTIKTEHEYDAQGRVTKTKQYPSDNPFTEDVDESAALHATTQTYNQLGKVETSTDKYGRTTRYYYDKRGNLVQTVYPDNTITRTVYDVNNRPIYQQAAHLPAAGDTLPFDDATTTFGTHNVYDAFGRAVLTEKLSAISISLSAVQNIDSQTVANMYESTVGALGTVLESTTTEYDAIGRVVKAIDATGAYRHFTYEDATVSTLAKKTTFVGAPAQTEIKIAEEEYDPNGNVVSSRTFDAGNLASVSSFEYDELNRQIVQRVHNLDDSVYSESKTEYDALGRRTQTTDADGKATGFAYDGAGRLRFVTEWLIEGAVKTPIVTEYTYDEVGNLIVQKDALNRETKYEYDNFGRRIHRTLPGGQNETLAYDVSTLSLLLESGQLVQRDFRTDFNGQITKRNYDVRGRLAWKGSGDGTTTLATFTYTPWGARQTMTDLSGTTTYIYGRVGSYTGNPVPGTFAYDSDRLMIRHQVNNGTPTSTDAFLYEHDAFGNLNRVGTKYTFTLSGNTVSAVSAPNTARTDVRYEYDWRNRLNKVRQGDNVEITSYTYSDPGVLKQTTYTLPGVHHTYAYNVANQLRNVVIDQNGVQLRKFDYNPAGHELAKSGQRKAAWEYGGIDGMGNDILRRKINYTQDSLNRLVSEDIVSDSSSTVIGKVDYAYDKVGNRLSRQSANGSSSLLLKIPNFALPVGLSHDANDRLPAPEVYDANGNTLQGDLNGVAGVEQTANDVYDLEDRLTTSTRLGKAVTLAYDGDGNRTRKAVTTSGTTTTRYVVDDRTPAGYAQVLEEWESVNGSAWTLTRKYTYGLSRIRQERVSGGVVVGTDYYGYDGHGSVALLANASGAVTDTYTYDAYGVLIAQSGNNSPNNYLYAAEQWDADLGMYYLRARYLNPQSGRFWTMDTFEGDSSTPLSLHKYLYAHNNPVNGWDPSGNDFVQSLGALYVSAQLAAMNFLAVAGSYGAAEFTLGIMALGYFEDINDGAYLAAGIGLGLDAVSFGQGGRIMRFPAWTKLSELKDWARSLFGEHQGSSRKAMAAALQFAEEIVPQSMIIAGKGGEGADIVAKVVVNGVERTLKRDVRVYSGDLTKSNGKNLYDYILEKGSQLSGAQIKQVFVQIGDNVKSVENWRQIVTEKAQSAMKDMGDVTVFVVDSQGTHILP